MASNDPILSISVAAKLLGVHPRSLMLYERAEIIFPHRTRSKRRLFSKNDLERLQFVKYLTQHQGINLKGVRTLLKALEVAENEGVNLKKTLFPDFKAKVLI